MSPEGLGSVPCWACQHGPLATQLFQSKQCQINKGQLRIFVENVISYFVSRVPLASVVVSPNQQVWSVQMGQHNWTAVSSGTRRWRRVDWERVKDFSETTSFSEPQIWHDDQTVRRHCLGDKCRQLIFCGTWPDSGSRPPLTGFRYHTQTHHTR